MVYAAFSQIVGQHADFVFLRGVRLSVREVGAQAHRAAFSQSAVLYVAFSEIARRADLILTWQPFYAFCRPRQGQVGLSRVGPSQRQVMAKSGPSQGQVRLTWP